MAPAAICWPGRGGRVERPKGIKAVIRSETDFAFVLYRTQLFNPGDIENVKRIQAGYKVRPLSEFLGVPPPAAAPAVDFIKPLTAEQERTSLQFFDVLNFILQFCPTDPSEKALMARFATIGVGAHKSIDANTLSPETRKALEEGMADAWAAFNEYKETQLDTGKKTSADGFGTRAALNNDYMSRMASAVLGIYGNSKDEALYPVYFVDSGNQKLDGANRYTLRFAPGQLPPVNAFWSLTLYELPASLLFANPLNRYLINSPMLAVVEAGRRRRNHAVHPERVAGRGQGGELAACAEGAVLHGVAAVLAEARRAHRQMEGAAVAADELNTRGERR